ncbi:MAG: hypothetical protein JWP61_515 [Friedmanniella sp.]|nr:hypothetical protein [Friedmanniella sp.]
MADSVTTASPGPGGPATPAATPARTVFKDLVLDALDGPGALAFWAPTLGLTGRADGHDGVLRDGVPQHTVWVNVVDEPKTVKNRVHLDVYVGSVAELTERGATVLTELPHWTVLADPQGNELCAFVRSGADLPPYRLFELGVDAVDPEALAGWWGERLGLTPQHEPEDDWWWVEGEPALPWAIVFNAVPEPRTVKNRVHWDVWGDTATLLAAGARLLRHRDDEIGWDVLADPEGNEFCVFARP